MPSRRMSCTTRNTSSTIVGASPREGSSNIKSRGALINPLPMANICRSEEHTSELQSHHDLVCRLLLEKKKHTLRPGHVAIRYITPTLRSVSRHRASCLI